MIINIKGNEGLLNGGSAGNTFFDSTCVRCVVTANAVVAIYDASNNQIGNTTLLTNGSGEYYIEKSPSEAIKLVSGTIKATPVGFTVG